MPSRVIAEPNPDGADDFDPMDDLEYAAGVQAYSDKFRRLRGRPRIRLSDTDGSTERRLPGFEPGCDVLTPSRS